MKLLMKSMQPIKMIVLPVAVKLINNVKVEYNIIYAMFLKCPNIELLPLEAVLSSGHPFSQELQFMCIQGQRFCMHGCHSFCTGASTQCFSWERIAPLEN